MFKKIKEFDFGKWVKGKGNVRQCLVYGIMCGFAVLLLVCLYCYLSNYFNTKALAILKQSMTSPYFVEIKTKEPNTIWMENQFLIIDNDNKSHIEIFYPKTGKINILPKSSLKGNHQKYFPLMHTPNKFVNINIVKEKDEDICGIEIFDIDTNKWQTLKTLPILRNAKNPPSVDIIYTKANKPLLLVWGGDNYKTGKAQNTIEIIDLFNDKLLEKTNIDFAGGKIFQYEKNYLVGAKIPKNNQNVIQFKTIKLDILPFPDDKLVLHEYHKIYTNTLSSSLDRNSILAINYQNKHLVEYDMPNSFTDSIKINKINIPKEYQNYSLINSIDIYQGALLIFSNNTEQLVVLFKQEQDIKQTKDTDTDYRFKLLKKVSVDIKLTDAKPIEYKNKNCIIYINKNKVFTLEIWE